MNLTLTLNFDSIDELQQFVNKTGSTMGAATNLDVSAPPTVLEAVPLPVTAPAPVVDPISPADPVEAVTAAAGKVDLSSDELRGTLMIRLRELAGSMDDPAVLGKFINGFGVARFSEIDDEDLPAFKTSLDVEFPVK